MKRTLKKALPVFTAPVAKKLRWKKIAGGISILADGTKIIKDQIFKTTADQIPKAFKKKFVCLDVQEEAQEPGIKIKLIPVGKNKWDILNEYTGDILNEEPLSATEAKAFLEEGESLPKEDPVTKKVTPSKKEAILKDKAKARRKAVPEDLPVETDDEEEYDN